MLNENDYTVKAKLYHMIYMCILLWHTVNRTFKYVKNM